MGVPGLLLRRREPAAAPRVAEHLADPPAVLAGLCRFLDLPFDARVAVCIEGTSYDNPTRLLWEAAAAVPFTAFCAAALVPEQTADKAVGYRVMGLPGAAPRGYRTGYSYRRRLSKERTRTGSLP